jgi:hypothetical protein
MKTQRFLFLGSAGTILSALLATMATAQELYQPVSYYDEAAAAAPAPAPADNGNLATAAPENSGEQICYQCCGDNWLAGPLEGPEAWTLSPKDCPTRVGGWVQGGYHSGSDGLFNNRPDKFNWHQVWLWLERTADGSKGIDWGYRADIMYGIDGADTQAFGNPVGTWDYMNGWDHGAYSWAMPQLYGTLAVDQLNVKFGHFYTPMGYEVVPAPGNFFYSHSFAFYYSEPITHTGALAEYPLSEHFKVFAGWTAGWDTAFEQFDNGSSFMGGFTAQLYERLKMTYLAMGGNFGWRGEGYMHSIVFDYQINERWNYVLQSDLVESDGSWAFDNNGDRIFEPGLNDDNYGINQYLFYTINYKLKTGVRAEWWKGDGISRYEVTYGVNYKPVPNFVLRPEVRHQWSPTAGADFEDQTIFGIDGYVTF